MFSVCQVSLIFYLVIILSRSNAFLTNDANDFRFANIFQDHMVLQRAPQRANVYGYASAIGEDIVLKFQVDSKVYSYTSQVKTVHGKKVGQWSFTLDPMHTKKAVTISVTLQSRPNMTIQITDVLFGDVWLCSGQSNMRFVLSMMDHGKEEIEKSHNFPGIRFSTVALKSANHSVDEIEEFSQKWTRPSKQSSQSFSAVCWIYGKIIHKNRGYPVGLITSAWGGTPIEVWMSRRALATCGLANYSYPIYPSRNHIPQKSSVCYNAMINPLSKFTIHGAIWYQGESNSFNTIRKTKYNCNFPAMISDWRKAFHMSSNKQTSSTFPFGFVQLAPFRRYNNHSTGYPDIRWHQTADYGYVPNSKMPKTFMAAALDLPGFNSKRGPIHPMDKIDIGERLALGGLSVAYGVNNLHDGPFPVNAKQINRNHLNISYGNKWTLVIKNTHGFEVLCSKNNQTAKWKSSEIVSYNATSIMLDVSFCSNIQSIRYEWKESPCSFKNCSVYSTTNDLPAPPFISGSPVVHLGKSVFHFGKSVAL